MRAAGPLALVALAALVALISPPQARGDPSKATTDAAAIPLFAYYYQWFDPTSWNRAKIDYPELGRYSSDDPSIMRQHIESAKAAGIDGFIVSWKSTTLDNRRLHALVQVAAQENFKLAMIYQGLDFSRNPLAPSRVAADFKTFRDDFSHDQVFYRLGGKTLTIWSGTWAYTHNQIGAVTGPVRSSMLVLSSEKSIGGYQRVADVTDGDAYYWSSVDPTTNRSYASKLSQLSSAVHRDGKYWIAPFAPGFDARMVGGSKTVPRSDGATLRVEYATALQSSPDALGLISWNEFSENTYVEPSKQFGHRFLDVLADLRHATAPVPQSAIDSSQSPPAANSRGNWRNVLVLGGFPVLLVIGLGILAAHRRRRSRQVLRPRTSRSDHVGTPMSRKGTP